MTKPMRATCVSLGSIFSILLAGGCGESTRTASNDAGAGGTTRDASMTSGAGGAKAGTAGGTNTGGTNTGGANAGGTSTSSGGTRADGGAGATPSRDGGPAGSAGSDAGSGCASGMDCDGGCFMPGDPKNCGACGNDCAALPNGATPLCAPKVGGGFSCVATCPAAAPRTCGSQCVDTTTNVANCVGCGNVCNAAVPHSVAACMNGCTFTCDVGWDRCANTCVDFMHDDANCGGCGAAFACNEPMRCKGGTCACPATCNGQCSDPDTDPKNCGRCGHDCLGGTCLKSACQPVVLATNQDLPWCMALDETHVYWTNYKGGTVMKVALDGTGLTELATGRDTPYSIAVDATSVYWVDASYDGIVLKAPLAGGTPVTLVQGSRNQFRAIGVDATRVYYADVGSSGSISAVPLGGGTPVKLAGGAPNAICHFGLDAKEIYWLAYPGQDAVDSVLLAGGPLRQVYAHPSRLGDIYGIALDANNVYWTEDTTGSVLQVPRGGGVATTLSSGGFTNGIAVDAKRVYWSDQQAASVRSVPVGGGTPTDVATGVAGVLDVAVDDVAVYFISGAGSVLKVAK